MKTRILLLLVIILLTPAAGVFAQTANSNLAKWQAVVKPDPAPPQGVPTFQASQSKASTKTSGLPHYYSAQRNLPPLPFNPNPELQLFDLGDNKFLYDDTAVDYFSLSAASFSLLEEGGGMSLMSMAPPCNPCSTNGNSGGGSSFSGPPAYSDVSTNLWVKITGTNGTNFLIDVNNTVSGTVYGVGVKSAMNDEPFNTWTLAEVFAATSTNKQFAGTASSATRFFNAVNLDAYTGPTVTILSPAPGSTVSNDVPLQIRVTDILPLSGLKVFVDAVQVGAIQSNQNGLVTIPTAWFANGPHQIWVVAANEGVPVDRDGDSVADALSPFHGSANMSLYFTNEVAMQNYSPLYTKSGSLTLNYKTTSPQNYTFEVFKTNGVLLHTASGQSANGSISRTWNFTDLTNNAVNDPVYVFALSYSAASGGNAAPPPVRQMFTTNFVDSGVTVGKYIISYGEWPTSSLNTGLANLNSYLSILVNYAAYLNEDVIGSGRENYNPPYVDFSSDAFVIRRNSQTNDLVALTNALKNPIVGSWMFDGHSSQNNLIHGRDQYLTVDLTAKNVAALLGNQYGFIQGRPYQLLYNRRLFSTFITGCSAASTASEFPDATGTPMGIDQVTNGQIKKSAFLGFQNLSGTGATFNNWIARVHHEWIDDEDYNTEITTAVWRANLAYPAVVNWAPTIYGYGFLGYNGNESR